MSASLVGSEMCIRDRHNAVLDLLGLVAAALLEWSRDARAVLHQLPWDLRRRSAAIFCLLYTSDAADDM
eukprot:12659214-Alexandrium_andersonii.AAC.1